MLHNNGAFTPSEAPVNLGAPINPPQMTPPILPHNYTDITKNPQINPLSSLPTYSGPNYPIYGHQEMNLGSETHPYTPFQNFHFGPPHSSQNMSNYHENSLSKLRNLLSTDPDIHSPNAMNFSNVYAKQVMANEQKQELTDNSCLKASQIHTKAFHKQVGMPVENQIIFNENLPFYSEEFRNSKQQAAFPNHNEDLNFNPQSSIPLESEQSKSNNSKDAKHSYSSQTSKDGEIQTNDDHIQSDPEINPLETSIQSITNVQAFKPETQSTISKSQSDSSNSSYKETSNSKSQVPEKIEVKPLISSLQRITTSVDVEEYTEVDYENPFVRDANGVENDDNIDQSVERAVFDIQNDAPHTNYKCEPCNLVFYHAKRFLIHHKWHNIAMKMDALKMSIKKEENTEDGEYECKDCNQFYPSKGKLRSHRFKFHSGARQCTVCEATLPNWRELKTHTEEQHMSGSVYKCAECGKVFKHRHTLARHSKVHGEKNFACEQCPKRFGSQLHLKTHMKSHERAERGPTHHCSFCGKGFHEAYYLQVHERSHRNEKPFSCDICGTSYSTNSSLQRHLKVSHNSLANKPYECAVCHRHFSSENTKDRHEIRFHQSQAKLKYQCNECSEKFLKAKDLTKHTYKCHPKARRRRHADE